MRAAEIKFDPTADGDTGSLDLASAYVRAVGLGLVVRYLVAMGPLLVAGWIWIDMVSAEDRASLVVGSVLVTGAMLWRWAGLVWLHSIVIRDVGGQGKLTPSRIAAIVVTRMAGFIMLSWGGVLILPALIGFYFSSFVSVLLLNPQISVDAGIRKAFGLVWNNLIRLWKFAAGKFILFTIGLLSVVLVQALLLWTVMPSLLGIDATNLQFAAQGAAWWLSLILLTWMVFDFFWAVASVFEIEKLQARRTGSDLSVRIAQLREANL